MPEQNQLENLEDEAIVPIQRIYKTIKFRSTLETRWAIFFDMLGWEWEYEPFGVKNTEAVWFPDFLIKGYGNKRILVEVKPFTTFQEFKELYETKYDRSLINTEYQFDEVLLLGSDIYKKCDIHQGPRLGWLVERSRWLDRFEIFSQVEEAVFWYKDDKYGFASDTSCWHCRITNNYEGGSGIKFPPYNKMLSLWIEAWEIAKTQEIYRGDITWSENITSV
ncbi:hypothetical protein [Acinetobacter tjernbergiae]|uniref:TnsA endonuclease N-terminal domain-containing protein n=1 Tax=Acinetobacter tjernbergiae DSM 14971 = CIP 107465 TaxID=1120928 RepID=V2UFQ5_9GAMM|nr:hypothetical protein [Acinetobacter tjernbergiae]ESK53613.1 hypothetical protein F990_03288 [Acinetobacter tjernbergiae DSM 14971 = CIP 107465]